MSKRDIACLDIEKFQILDAVFVHGYFVIANYWELLGKDLEIT